MIDSSGQKLPRILIIDDGTLCSSSIVKTLTSQNLVVGYGRLTTLSDVFQEPRLGKIDPHLARQFIRRPGETVKAHKARVKAFVNNPDR